ncbi:MAG: hypothetical protein Q4Q28_06060 [Bacteroidales bacterium]|nr:hypothetical protein [Bacteroidales bacterium]
MLISLRPSTPVQQGQLCYCGDGAPGAHALEGGAWNAVLAFFYVVASSQIFPQKLNNNFLQLQRYCVSPKLPNFSPKIALFFPKNVLKQRESTKKKITV